MEHFIYIFINYFLIVTLLIFAVIGVGVMRVEQFICDRCSKTFNREHRLNKHTEKCEKHECITCAKVFEKAWHLKRHKENANIVSCDGHCLRRFCSIDELEKHQHSTQQQQLMVTNKHVDTKLCPPTGYKHLDGYVQEINNHV